MGYDRYFPSVSLLVLNVNQFVGRGGGPLEWQKQDSHVYRKTGTFLVTSLKSEIVLGKKRPIDEYQDIFNILQYFQLIVLGLNFQHDYRYDKPRCDEQVWWG